MPSTLHQHVCLLLQELERALGRAQLWQAEPVNSQLLRSAAPFCCDTLRFEQWLQFVFIPKMSRLAEQEDPLPNNIALAPMAEMTLCSHSNYDNVHDVLVRLDNSLTKGEKC
ncbi:hypothetical protein PSECIP111951_02997 [Pseudoalteromonas holothuriae]|uniref:YqcC-like domain-containing protein n=1 Tax=Pseudoalteromonas holothuriae TaxID=2963714 RepID=A0A9W4W6Z7_9GAMM|nr:MULTISPECIES: YqcC family protein [unclassified Pseudoalteromonas]CAH9063912.1 hypothetical protein PSECIP111951_02997 [Pseudoalteromonas sp. CIP111951]CAH9065005.1 hypothetical protein PSECIP111854_03586 [Pseudoalteromonas sp. CIP111854]